MALIWKDEHSPQGTRGQQVCNCFWGRSRLLLSSVMATLPGTAPIFVDATVGEDEQHFVRCNYLAIESDEPMPGWGLRINSSPPLPFFMLGLEGIIISPPGGGQFISSGSVDATFDLLEKRGLTVETGDLWFPHFLFRKELADIVAGQVFRVDGELFASAFRYRDGHSSWAEFAGFCREARAPLFSNEETQIFTDWSQRVRAIVVEQQFQRRDRMLKPLN